jgi:hypothetical protein
MGTPKKNTDPVNGSGPTDISLGETNKNTKTPDPKPPRDSTQGQRSTRRKESSRKKRTRRHLKSKNGVLTKSDLDCAHEIFSDLIHSRLEYFWDHFCNETEAHSPEK